VKLQKTLPIKNTPPEYNEVTHCITVEIYHYHFSSWSLLLSTDRCRTKFRRLTTAKKDAVK